MLTPVPGEPVSPTRGRHLDHPTTRLWLDFDPDVAHKARLPLFCGVPPQLVDDVMLLSAARSRPAVRLVSRTPEILRGLAHQTTAHTERCVGHVRGPILWSETITAWSSGIGVDDIFICTSPRRDFDVPENRLLVWLLRRLVAAGRRASGDGAKWFAPESIEQVKLQARSAQKLVDHRALQGIKVRRIDSREMRLIRKSRHAATYAPALKLAERVARPFDREEARALVGQETVEHHRVMNMILDAFRDRGHAVPMLSVRGDFVVAGPLRYRSPLIFVDRRLSAMSGLLLGDVRLLSRMDEPWPGDVRADGSPRRQVRIESDEDAGALVDEALAASARAATPPAAPTGSAHSASGFVQLPGS
ncbi:MAG: hypothetical protein U0Q22_07610 [Acidimicrobiales bacterium]